MREDQEARTIVVVDICGGEATTQCQATPATTKLWSIGRLAVSHQRVTRNIKDNFVIRRVVEQKELEAGVGAWTGQSWKKRNKVGGDQHQGIRAMPHGRVKQPGEIRSREISHDTTFKLSEYMTTAHRCSVQRIEERIQACSLHRHRYHIPHNRSSIQGKRCLNITLVKASSWGRSLGRFPNVHFEEQVKGPLVDERPRQLTLNRKVGLPQFVGPPRFGRRRCRRPAGFR